MLRGATGRIGLTRRVIAPVAGPSRFLRPLSVARPLVRGPRARTLRPHRRCLHCSPVRHNEAGAKDPGESSAKTAKTRSTEEKASFKDPTTRYQYLVSIGRLKADPHQESIISKLQRLWDDLKSYDPGPIPPEPDHPKQGMFRRLFGNKPAQPSPTKDLSEVPKGLYLYGSVGTGKTMLMDLFYSTLPPKLSPSKYGSIRIHFHNFMLEFQRRQHVMNKHYADLGLGSRDTLPEVARSWAAEGRVLCFDEFQVTDIVTAMILRQLLERLMGFGVVCVMTSNRHPDELYMNGIQRNSFLPCIELLTTKFEVVDLDSQTDYRKIPRSLSHTYYHPLTSAVQSEMGKLFESIVSTDAVSTDLVENRRLPLWGRHLTVPESSGSVAKFTFNDLCGKPLSAADYMEVTNNFGTVFVEGIPRMGLSERDQARRFITFIDACYENQTKLFVSSEVPIFQVFSDDKGKSAQDDEHMRSVMDDLGLSAEDVGSSSLFSGDEELFAFARCVSRLSQMGTQEWAEEAGMNRDHRRSETSATE